MVMNLAHLEELERDSNDFAIEAGLCRAAFNIPRSGTDQRCLSQSHCVDRNRALSMREVNEIYKVIRNGDQKS